MTFLTEAGRKGSCPRLAFVYPRWHVSLSLSVLVWTAGPDMAHPLLVQTALSSLASVGTTFQFPPINWGLSLAPLMRLGFGKVHHSPHLCPPRTAGQPADAAFCRQERTSSISVWCWQPPRLTHPIALLSS